MTAVRPLAPGAEHWPMPASPELRTSLTLALRAASGPVPTMAAAWLSAFVLSILQSPDLALLIALGFAGAFVAGLVGVGGAIVMIPLLLYVPPLFRQPALAMHTVAGISMIQVAAAGIAGLLGHVGHQRIDRQLVLVLGGSMVVGSAAGAAGSRLISGDALRAVFAVLALVAAVVMFRPRREPGGGSQRSDPPFNRWLAMGSGVGVGTLVGMVGAGGGFVLVPLMLYVLRIPLRAAVGASLAIVVLSGMAGSVGKAVTGQVEWLLALALVVGALPGARLGASVSRRVKTETLGYILGGLIALAALKMWWEILLTVGRW